MWLGQDPASDEFAKWLLEIGAGKGTDRDGTVTLPICMHCVNNDIQSLINALYFPVLFPGHPPVDDSFFLEYTILSAKNTDVDEINTTILDLFPGDKAVFTSADSVTERDYDYIPVEFLHTLTPSGFPLHTLEVKAGAPLMLLHNLNPLEGLYNGTCMILLSWTTCILRCCILRDGVNEAHLDNQNTVLIPHDPRCHF